jgi:nucleoside-diphosphate-sugar epimerase
MAQPKILVTGAGGFIGAGLLPVLARKFGAVSAGFRRARPSALPGVTAVACDLDDSAQLRAALAGADLVIHAAYGDEAAMPAQARRLLEAMSTVGVKNLLAFSSIAIYGARTGAVVETDGPVGKLSAYAQAKLDCEALYRDWAAQDEARRALILRPGIVYGAGSPFWVEKMGARVASGGWGLFGRRGEGRAALIHLDDLAAQVAAASASLLGGRDLPGFSALNAVGPESPLWNDYFAALAQAIGCGPLRTWSPAEIFVRQALAAPAKILRKLGLPLGATAALAPTPGEMDLFSLDATYSGAAAELLGFSPAIGMEEGLRRCGLASRLR